MASADDFANQVTGAANQGQGAINAFNPSDVAGTQRSGLFGSTGMVGNAMGAGGPLTSQDYFNKYSSAVAANPSVTGLYNTANTMFNVPDLQKQANYLNQQVANIAPNQYNLARGFDVGDAQVQNAINTNLRFLSPQATAATQNANTAAGLASNYVTAGMQQNQLNLLPVQQQGDVLTQALASAQTGWNQANANELQALQAKMQAGVQLSEQEMANYTSLSNSKRAYDQAIATAQIGQRYQTLNPAQTLVNTLTGGTYRAR